MGDGQRANAELGALLDELGWSPSQLATAVNGGLGTGYVGRSTVSDWVHRDRLPRDPLPTVVAHLIADTLDRQVTVETLWSGRARPAQFWVPADHGLALPWTAAGTVEVLDDWLRHTGGSIGMDRRIFLAVSGASLTAPAWAYVDHLGSRGVSLAALADSRRSITITNAMVDTVATTTAAIRTLGNTEGGNEDNLRFVHHHLIWVAKLLRQARFTSAAVADRLLSEWAQLSTVAGWIAHDAGKHGLSQRYFCATRRSDVYPAQRGEIGGGISGSNGLPGSRKRKGTIACQETSGRAQAYGARRWGIRVIRPRLDCRNPNLQKVRVDARRKDA